MQSGRKSEIICLILGMMVNTILQAKILQAYNAFQTNLLVQYQNITHINPASAQLPIMVRQLDGIDLYAITVHLKLFNSLFLISRFSQNTLIR